jgi:hypothetical protein
MQDTKGAYHTKITPFHISHVAFDTPTGIHPRRLAVTPIVPNAPVAPFPPESSSKLDRVTDALITIDAPPCERPATSCA